MDILKELINNIEAQTLVIFYPPQRPLLFSIFRLLRVLWGNPTGASSKERACNWLWPRKGVLKKETEGVKNQQCKKEDD